MKIRRNLQFCGAGPSCALTLLELLVVITIIAILSGLILPVIGHGKAKARRVACINRLKQWTLGFGQYADENGTIPREGHHWDGRVRLNNWNMIRDERSQDVWYNALSNYVGNAPASSYYPSANRSRFYESPSLFHCPSAGSWLRKLDQGISLYRAYFSVAMNSQLIEPFSAPTIRAASITRPSRTVTFLDNRLQDEAMVVPTQPIDNLGQPAAEPGRFAGLRHENGGNLSFADGHVEWFPHSRVVEMQGPYRGFSKQNQRDIQWSVP